MVIVLLVAAFYFGRRHPVRLTSGGRHSRNNADPVLTRFNIATSREDTMPIPTRPLRALPPVGVAMLIFRGTRISPPHFEHGEPEPGIRSTPFEGRDDAVLIEAIGYETGAEAHTALARAEQACIDSGLLVQTAPISEPLYPCRLVRRRLPDAFA